jgi:uncharacterized delta-60 repeat protein
VSPRRTNRLNARRALRAATRPLIEAIERRVLLSAAGDLDPTFGGGDGKLTFEYGHNANRAHDLAVLADGRFLVVGTGNLAAQLTRYNADGSPDTTFGDDGQVFLEKPTTGEAVLLLSGGKLLVTGEGGTARLNADGTPDLSFGGGDGVADGAGGRALAVQSDGRILVGGDSTTTGGVENDFLVTRLTAAGAIDPTFGGGDGRVTAAFAGNDQLNALAVLADGRILAAGAEDRLRVATGGGDLGDFAVARFTSAGALDPSFGGGDGKVTTDFGGPFGAYDLGHDLALLSGGKFLVSGIAGSSFAVARYNADGSLDTTFSPGGTEGGGRVALPFDAYQGVDSFVKPHTAIDLDASGRIVLAGGADGGNRRDALFGVVRLTPDGAPDPTFGDGTAGPGIVHTPFEVLDLAVAV